MASLRQTHSSPSHTLRTHRATRSAHTSSTRASSQGNSSLTSLMGPARQRRQGRARRRLWTPKYSAPYGTPRNTSTAPNTSATPECENYVMRPISNLPGATSKHQGRCSVCKSRFTGRAPKVNKYCEACSDIDIGKLVFVCSRKRGAAETHDSCYSYHIRHPLDVIPAHPDFLKVHNE